MHNCKASVYKSYFPAITVLQFLSHMVNCQNIKNVNFIFSDHYWNIYQPTQYDDVSVTLSKLSEFSCTSAMPQPPVLHYNRYWFLRKLFVFANLHDMSDNVMYYIWTLTKFCIYSMQPKPPKLYVYSLYICVTIINK